MVMAGVLGVGGMVGKWMNGCICGRRACVSIKESMTPHTHIHTYLDSGVKQHPVVALASAQDVRKLGACCWGVSCVCVLIRV